MIMIIIIVRVYAYCDATIMLSIVLPLDSTLVKCPNVSAYNCSGLTICDYHVVDRTSLRLDNVLARFEIPVDVGVDRGIRSSATRI